MSVFRSVASSELSHAGPRCSAQPPFLLTVYSFLLSLFTGSNPTGATLSRPDRMLQSQVGVLWDAIGGLVILARLVLKMVFALSFQSCLLSIPTILLYGPCG